MTGLAALYRSFSIHSAGHYAPLYRDITRSIADDPALLSLVEAAPADARHPTVILAAVRYLLSDHPDHPLAGIYAGSSGDPEAAFRSFVLDHRDAIHSVMAHRRTQTNEIARSAVLVPAVAEVRRRVARPLALIDVGTSAGLNLLLDRVHIDYGRHTTGPADSPVQLTCEVLGDTPLPTGPTDIGWRAGLDRRPVHVSSAADVRWLESCVWPEHPDRLLRLRAGLALAAQTPPHLVAGDAVADLGPLVHSAPVDHHLVVMTSWAIFYLGPDERHAFEAVLMGAGRPLSWIGAEHPSVLKDLDGVRPSRSSVEDKSVIGLVTFAGDANPGEREFLGWAHNHGAWIDWHYTAG